MNNQAYQLLEHGVITKHFFSFQRMREYLAANYTTTDVAALRKHGVNVREVPNE